MSAAAETRTGIVIVTELLDLTKEMSKKMDDPDFLIASVEKRQELMDEFDQLKATDPDSTSVELHPELKTMAKTIIYLDSRLSSAIKKHMEEAKSQLKENTTHQRVLNYVNKAMSSSGHYMDYKK